MNDSPSIAVAYYPEGAGHATRMLAIADALGDAGAGVTMAGGGDGARFVALNGYDEFEPTPVDFIDSYQGGTMRQVLGRSVPASADRVADYAGWLRDAAPDALVTDDMFAVIAASRTDVPVYALKHDPPALYRDRLERSGARFHTGIQSAVARALFYPAVWPPETDDPAGATRVPPVALPGDGSVEDGPDVLVVPSHYSDLDRVTVNLERQGYDVLDVGGDDWEPVPSLLPYVRAADVVVCSGYSTVMDAAVAGTPCVVHPATDEQDAVAARLERSDVDGFAVARTQLSVLDAVAAPPAPPAFENGAATVADRVLDDLQKREPTRSGGLPGALAAVPIVATVTPVGRPLPPAVETAAGGVATAAAGARRIGRRLGDWTVAAAVGLVAAAFALAGRCRRYGVALAALRAGVAAAARSRARRATGNAAARIRTSVRVLAPAGRWSRRRAVAAGRNIRRTGSRLRAGIRRLRRQVGDATGG